jgi:hypothetical protein
VLYLKTYMYFRFFGPGALRALGIGMPFASNGGGALFDPGAGPLRFGAGFGVDASSLVAGGVGFVSPDAPGPGVESSCLIVTGGGSDDASDAAFEV